MPAILLIDTRDHPCVIGPDRAMLRLIVTKSLAPRDLARPMSEAPSRQALRRRLWRS